ncbi:cache domain-containing sensor histidine kinase [Paenibacillus thalictri]|uniref:Sensor histidine kinase n=1 Tax=Paenibacillus thalictri TaxID=2527873 RepID=A0A4Q9DRI6_9BACL|nr:sensor histidine kinase [Paenibacillus thalictri]TBL79407.1 sensor histidine kinase [Paenibacillus thalictri]
MRQWRLKPFLFCSLVLSNILFLIVITVAIYFSVSYFFTKQISEARLQGLHSNQLQLIERLKDIEGTALTISTHQTMKTVLEENSGIDLYEYIVIQRNVNEWLSTFTFVKPFINSVQIFTDQYVQYQKIGPAGKNTILPLAKLPVSLSSFDKVDAIWIPAHRDGTLESNEKPVLTYILKMYNRKGGTAGFVAIHLDEDSLTRLLFSENTVSSPTNRSLLLLDAGNQVMSRMSAQVNSQRMESFQAHTSALASEAGFKPIELEGNKYLMIYTSQSQEKWRIAEFLESDELYRDVNTIRNIVLMIGGVVLLCVFPVASYLASRMIRPVPLLLKGFQKIENGNFDADVEQHFIVEFNKLIIGFNFMTGRLKMMLEELEQKNRLKRDLELMVLQSQINPHFLYNTLDMINWAAAVKGNTEVSFMAARLAKLFRISLSGGSTFIPLKDELEHARLYAQIQQTRLEDRFVYNEHVSPFFKQCYVPKIILQPFIENAIIHGFAGLQEGQKAEVAVSAERIDESRFRIVIADNGVGLKQSKDESERRKTSSLYVSGSGGYGIKNVRERLELYLGEQYGLIIENRDGGGVNVDLTLPYLDSLEKANEFNKSR